MKAYIAKIFSNGQQVISKVGDDLDQLITGVLTLLEDECYNGATAQIFCAQTGKELKTFRKSNTE